MGVPREDLLLMMRALKRGIADVKAIRKALDRQVSKPISFVEALHLRTEEVQALQLDSSMPDPVQDRPVLEPLHQMLVEGEYEAPHEWEKFVASLVRPTQRQGHAGLSVPGEFDGYTLQWELARRERGVVYRAKDRDGREVAIKVFREDVKPADWLPKVGGLSYAVSEFVDGESFESKKPGPRRGVEAVRKAADITRSKPHGALTPARIVIRRDDSTGVLGFEYARAVPPSNRAQAYGPGDDVRALGAILYELIVGAPPAGESSPLARTKEVDASLDRIVSCALTGGYGSTGELADDLGRYLRNEPVTARKASAAASGRRKPWVWVVAAAVPLAALVLYFALRPPAPPALPPAVKAPEPPREAKKPEPPPSPPKETAKPPAPKPPAPAGPLTTEEEQKLTEACMKAMESGDHTRVIALANEALSRGSKKEWPLYHLAVAFIEKDELDKALEYVTRALEGSPDSKDYLELRMEVFAFRGEVKKALADLEKLWGTKAADMNRHILKASAQIRANPKDGRSHLLRGVFYHVKRHPEAAGKDFTAAVELGQKRALAWRAVNLASAEDRAGAAADAKAFLAQFPNDFASAEVKALLAAVEPQ